MQGYSILYGSEPIHDPFDRTLQCFDVGIEGALNAVGGLSLSMAEGHPMAGKIRQRGLVRALHNGKVIFEGYVYSIGSVEDGVIRVMCFGELAYLRDVLVRPYSTIETEGMEKAPDEPGALFEWYIAKYNERASVPFEVGINHGSMLDPNGHVYRESAQRPNVAQEVQEKIIDSLGGYIRVRHEGSTRYIDLLADFDDVNAQLIDFGQNMLSFSDEDSTEETYTAIVAVGGEMADKTDCTLALLPDGEYGGFIKSGDALYDPDAVRLYGYREMLWEGSDATNPDNLLTATAAQLRAACSPFHSVEVKAVDAALYMDGYEHLTTGQVVRVCNARKGIDRYMVVSAMSLDMDNPENTLFTLGDTFETMTDQQSRRLRSLTATINSSVDRVDSLSEDVVAKAKVFYGQPTPPYNAGDLWVDSDMNSIMVCVNSRQE